MDRKLRKILTECIQDVETGARDIEGCLQRHPDRAADLRPHLELWRGLNAAAKAQPNSGSQQRGQHQLLAALSDMKTRGKRRMIPFLTPALVKSAAVVAGVALLAGGAAGASAAFGGPNVADEVLTAVGVTNGSDHGPNENANPNAFEGSDNAGQGIGNASETGRDHANPNALDGPDNADQDTDGSDAAEDGLNTAEENTADQADDGLNTAGDAGTPDDVPPNSPPVPDSVPDSAPIPDSLPAVP